MGTLARTLKKKKIINFCYISSTKTEQIQPQRFIFTRTFNFQFRIQQKVTSHNRPNTKAMCNYIWPQFYFLKLWRDFDSTSISRLKYQPLGRIFAPQPQLGEDGHITVEIAQRATWSTSLQPNQQFDFNMWLAQLHSEYVARGTRGHKRRRVGYIQPSNFSSSVPETWIIGILTPYNRTQEPNSWLLRTSESTVPCGSQEH